MRRILFFALAALAVLNCGGDSDGLPLLGSADDGFASSSSRASSSSYGSQSIPSSSSSASSSSFAIWASSSSYNYYSSSSSFGGSSSSAIYTLYTNAIPYEGGTVNPPPSSYAHGTIVTATAIENAGYRFVRWSGASTSTSASIQINMHRDTTLTAEFELLYSSSSSSSRPSSSSFSSSSSRPPSSSSSQTAVALSSSSSGTLGVSCYEQFSIHAGKTIIEIVNISQYNSCNLLSCAANSNTAMYVNGNSASGVSWLTYDIGNASIGDKFLIETDGEISCQIL